MAQRMRKKRHFDERMSATQKWLLARGAGGILNMKEWRNEGRRNSYEKESRMIMDSLKNEYRSSVSNG